MTSRNIGMASLQSDWIALYTTKWHNSRMGIFPGPSPLPIRPGYIRSTWRVFRKYFEDARYMIMHETRVFLHFAQFRSDGKWPDNIMSSCVRVWFMCCANNLLIVVELILWSRQDLSHSRSLPCKLQSNSPSLPLALH